MTEEISERFEEFDLWATQDAVKAMYEGQLAALAAIEPALDDITNAADAAANALSNNGRLVYIGAGTSGRLAVQDGVELRPTFGWPMERLKFCVAGGMDALMVSAEGAEDDEKDGSNQIEKANVGAGDVVIAVAASGRTPFTHSALKRAKQLGATTISIANNPDTPLLLDAHYPILAQTGSELVAGSTRMKAGTSQKVILNILSTAIMRKIGRVYKGYMVDMIISNAKLESRAIDMICSIANCKSQQAKDALTMSDRHIKTAILICMGKTLTESQDILMRSNQSLRKALTLLNR